MQVTRVATVLTAQQPLEVWPGTLRATLPRPAWPRTPLRARGPRVPQKAKSKRRSWLHNGPGLYFIKNMQTVRTSMHVGDCATMVLESGLGLYRLYGTSLLREPGPNGAGGL